jgi:hypothetical protein
MLTKSSVLQWLPEQTHCMLGAKHAELLTCHSAAHLAQLTVIGITHKSGQKHKKLQPTTTASYDGII